MAIFYITCVRFYNTTILAVLHTLDKDEGRVTLIQYDSSCNPVTPVYVSRNDLCPPDDWVTNWGKPTKKPVAAAQSIITEIDGKVTTRFPRVNTVQHGGPSTSFSAIPTTISQLHLGQTTTPPQFVIDQAVYDSIIRLFS